MNSPTRDHLLGYLLKALAPEEQEQVETELNQNPSLRAELRQIESRLGQMGLGNEREYVDPPAGLAQTGEGLGAGVFVEHGAVDVEQQFARVEGADAVAVDQLVVERSGLSHAPSGLPAQRIGAVPKIAERRAALHAKAEWFHSVAPDGT